MIRGEGRARDFALPPDGHLSFEGSHLVRETALAQGAWQACLHRMNQSWWAFRGDENGVGEPSGFQVQKEVAAACGVFLRARLQAHEDVVAAHRDRSGREHRLARLPEVHALGHPAKEQIRHLDPREIAPGELLVVGP